MTKKPKSPAKTGKNRQAPPSEMPENGSTGAPDAPGADNPAAAETENTAQAETTVQTDTAAAAETAETAQAADPLAEYDAAALRDLYLRAIADKENILKRAETEIKKTRDFTLNQFSRGICEVRDCLEAAETALSGGEKTTGEGISLTLKKLTAVMETNGIRPVRPDIGAPFDPELHMAIGIDSGGKHAANTVAAVVQCGYTLNGRVVRAAGVMVGKPAEKNGD